MKRLISALLATAMLISALPTLVFADEENNFTENAVETTAEEMPSLGSEATIGNVVFYIEDGTLLRSENNARPKTVDENVSWIIEENNKFYWSKLEEHSTSSIYFCSANDTTGEALTKLFVPTEAFDVDGNDLYYLYNGEIVKLNLETNEEQSMGMFECDGFLVEENTIRIIKRHIEELTSNDAELQTYSCGTDLSVSQAKEIAGKVNGSVVNESVRKKYIELLDTWQLNPEGYGTTGTFLKSKQWKNDINSYISVGGTDGGSKTCLGFAKYVFAYIFGIYALDNAYTQKVCVGCSKLTYNDFINNGVVPGAYIQGDGHTITILAYDQNDVYIYDGNWQRNTVGGIEYSRIRVSKYSWNTMMDRLKGYCNKIIMPKDASKINISSGNITKPVSTTKPSVPQADKNIYISITNCPSDNFIAKSFTLGGSISSAYSITWVTAWLKNTTTGETISRYDGGFNSKKINLAGSAIDKAMRFDKCLTPGTYELAVGAANSAGVSGVYEKKYFTVSGGDLKQPQISVSSLEEGQRVTITSSDGGYLHYNLNGGYGGEGSSITKDLTTAGSYNFYVWETKSGYNDSPAITRSVSVQKADTPIIGDVKYGANNAWVTISGNGNIYYTKNGSNPNKKSSSYNGTIYLYDSTTIKAMSTQYGKVNSDVATKYLSVSAPDTPSGLKLYNTKEKIAQGKTATFSWNSANRATSYEATLYYNGEQVGKSYETKGTTAAFKLTETGVYTVKVKAKNFKGASAESSAVSVESMAPVTVKFVDRILREGKVTDEVVNQIQQNVNAHYGEEVKEIEGNVISVQKIDYDTKPNVPTWDDKEGFSRQYFEGINKNITEDTTIYAYYKVKDYNVQFWNYWTYDSENNTQIGETQNILYSYSAKAPTEMNVPTGYTLAGWNVDAKSECYDFTFVNGNMKLYTSYTWENKDLPVVMEFVSAQRGNTCQSYDITLKYINNNLTDTQARIIMSLYTADGRMVYTATEDVDLMARDPGIYYTETIQATYPNRISKISAVMVQVKNDKTGGAVSKMISTTDIDMPNDGTTWTAWSSWSTTNPGTEPARYSDVKGNTREVESKTQYRARSKQYTTSNNTKSLSGWNYSYTDTYPGNWIDNGTAWVGAENSDYRKREVSSTWNKTYKTQWLYSRYVYNGKVQPYQSASYTYYEDTGWRDYALPFEHYVNFARGTYASYNPYWSWQAINDGIATRDRNWYNEQTRTVENGGYYTYKYKDTYYTHHFWKWNSWSDWSDKSVSGDKIQKRTVYRWRDNFNNYPGYDPNRDSTLEEETINTYEISGNINGLTKDYNGKLATALVYKKTNTDPTQEQLEYVDQITIGENNSYSFIVNPKEEINYEDTGDYIVTLSLEGSENLANIDVIKAPVPQCKVTFQNDDGSILKDENGNDLIKYVDKNGSLDVNEITIPTKEGYRFVKWDRSLINIANDITVAPLWEKEVYNVVYVDYENQTADMVEVSYGDPINLPEVEEVEGKEFIGWDAECYKYATEGNVDTDIFNIKEEAPYYLTTDGTYILVSDYNSVEHNIVDETEYYKYFSEKNTIITESKIVTAKWKTNEYTVRFCDFDGNVIDGDLGEQTVKYGESAQLPDFVEKDGVLYSWDLTGEEWWNVTKDMIITPYVPQEVQVDAPTISAPTTDAFGEYTAELEANGENMKIYYTLDCTITESDARKFVAMLNETDGTEDEETAETEISLMSDESDDEPTEVDGSDETDININDYIEEYTEPISLYAGNVVYAFTVDKDGNISPVSVFQYDYDITDETFGDVSNEYVPDSDVPQITMATINAKPGETVSVPVKIKNNMGITNLSMILGYDAEDLTLLTTENGDVFAENEFSQDVREDGSCKFVWECENDNFNDGTLMNLTFKVKDSAEKEKYMLDLRVEYSGDENDEEWYFVTVPGALTGEETLNGTLGDINEDGDVDFSDAIVILKYDAGLKDIDESKLPLGDVNGDGDVDFSDAILIIKFDAGLISEFKKNN